MKERSILALLVIGLLLVSGVQLYLGFFHSDFTFQSADIKFNGNLVQETLKYVPNKPYHTLYRNFQTSMYSNGSDLAYPMAPASSFRIDTIFVKGVKCSEGIWYVKDTFGAIFSQSSGQLSNTEKNEYGCGFGDIKGFSKGKEYTIYADYELRPNTLFLYRGKHYIKFVAYSGGEHPLMIRGKNFFVPDNVITGKYVFQFQDLIVYVPFEPQDISSYEIRETSSLAYGLRWWEILLIVWILLPAIACFAVWYIFGREKSEGDFPEELSQYPKERKAWEVSTYFHPPFGELDENFLPAMVLDLYNRKIISIQERKTGLIIKQPEIFIKINPLPPKERLDEIETKIMEFLKSIEVLEKSQDGYFSIKSAASGFSSGFAAKKDFEKLKKEIKKKSKEHVSYAGITAIWVAIGIIQVPMILLGVSDLFTYLILICVGLAAHKTSLFIRFKDDYNIEYQQWQGFRKYLSTLDSMKRTPPKGVVLWEKYLVYATAMGVGKKVLSAMKGMNIIDERTYDGYALLYTHTAFGSFSSSGGIGGSGVGGSGVGGGGIGGGGGGGR